MKSIAIMQPTFLPWIGYFALIDRVDEFVFLDNVQFERRSWQQRNRVKTANGQAWLTVSVLNKGMRDQLIADVEVQQDGRCLEKICKTIEHSYKKAPYFTDYWSEISAVLLGEEASLATLNICLIEHLCTKLGIRARFVRSSALDGRGAKADLLVDICQKCEASVYVSPPGSQEYLDKSSAFADAGIEVVYHQYDHPVYKQLYGEFEPYMCILDLLFNEGVSSLEIIRNGVRL